MEQIKLMDTFMQLKYVKYSRNIIDNILYKRYIYILLCYIFIFSSYFHYMNIK